MCGTVLRSKKPCDRLPLRAWNKLEILYAPDVQLRPRTCSFGTFMELWRRRVEAAGSAKARTGLKGWQESARMRCGDCGWARCVVEIAAYARFRAVFFGNLARMPSNALFQRREIVHLRVSGPNRIECMEQIAHSSACLPDSRNHLLEKRHDHSCPVACGRLNAPSVNQAEVASQGEHSSTPRI